MRNFTRSRKFMIGASIAAVVTALAGGPALHLGLVGNARAQGAGDVQVPYFQADALWPKPLPNNWVIGSTIGLDVDKNDNVWIVHRPGTLAANERPTSPARSPPAARRRRMFWSSIPPAN